MKEDVIKKKLSKIGLNVNYIKFLDVGTSKDSYLISANKKKYVLKLFMKETRRKVQRQMNLMKKINKLEKITIFPIHQKILDFVSKVGYVYEFIEGKTYHQTKIRNKLYSFGKVIGHFNKLTKDILPNKKDTNRIFNEAKTAKRSLVYVDSKSDLLHRKAKKLIELSVSIINKEYKGAPLRTQLIHGDLHQDNVYFVNKKSIIIDMDGLENSILLGEISTYLSYISYRSMEKYEREIKKLFEGYEAEFKLTKKEKRLIPIIMITRKLGEVSYLLEQEYKGKLTKKEIDFFLGHTTRKLKFIINNYKSIKSVFSNL